MDVDEIAPLFGVTVIPPDLRCAMLKATAVEAELHEIASHTAVSPGEILTSLKGDEMRQLQERDPVVSRLRHSVSKERNHNQRTSRENPRRLRSHTGSTTDMCGWMKSCTTVLPIPSSVS